MATKKPSIKELTAKLQGVSTAAKSLGIDTGKADAMVAQTERQGSKKFAGSKEEKAYTKAQAEAGGVGVISSNQGKGLVKTADDTMTRLAPEMPTVGLTPEQKKNEDAAQAIRFGTAGAPGATTEPKQKDTAGNFVTYYNEKTGQEQTLRGDAITDANKQALEQSGYTVASADTSTDTTENPEITSLETQITTGQTAIDGFMKKLEASLITDKELRGDIRTISQGYAARMDEARQITEQRKQTIQTLGARTGARYTGGMGGVLGGIISEEERQGLMRITEIENSKQEAIRNAKTEARNYNYNAYTKLMAQADTYQQQKVEELATLKKAQAEQDKLIEGERKRAETESYIAGLISSGTKDPIDIYTELAAAGKLGDYTLSDVLKISGTLDNIESLKPKKAASTAGDSYADVPEDGYDITEGFNFGKAKTKDYKDLARKLFPGDFGNKMLVELTDEELIEFITDYTNDSNANQQKIDPEAYYLDWVEKSGAVKETTDDSNFKKKMEQLKATYEESK